MMRKPIETWITVVLLTVALVLPGQLDSSHLTVYVICGLTCMVVIGLSMLMGYAGQVSFGQAAYYAVGAYCAAKLSLSGMNTLLALILSPLAAMLVALLIGLPLLRLRGFYLSFATIAVQLILLSTVSSVASLGGEIGLPEVPSLRIGTFSFDTPQSFAYLTLFFTALLMLGYRQIINSRFGRAFQALSTGEAAAESCGVDVYRYKLLVFVLSAAFAGLAGGLYAFFMSYVSPTAFPLLLSFQLVVMSLLGGLRSLSGPLVGTLAITFLVQFLNYLGTVPGMPLSAPAILSYGTYSILVIVVALFLPDGISSVLKGLLKPPPHEKAGVIPIRSKLEP